MNMEYGRPALLISCHTFDLPEVMYYLYLPVFMGDIAGDVRLPPNVACCRQMIETAAARVRGRGKPYRYIYLSARKGFATPDNPLNRPGWHCDGFGTEDLNYVWWRGPGTRFAVQKFHEISTDHVVSMRQFEEQVDSRDVETRPECCLYEIDPYCVHATPIIKPPGCMRQYVKISFSNHRYDLENNSHNYLFEYDWKLHRRDLVRNDPHKAQRDYVE